jgi:anaerobic selenocysteine-containing dehydrogenase
MTSKPPGGWRSPCTTTRTLTRYVPVSWEAAFDPAGRALRGLPSPHQAAFYTSGRLSNEATFLYQL